MKELEKNWDGNNSEEQNSDRKFVTFFLGFAENPKLFETDDGPELFWVWEKSLGGGFNCQDWLMIKG